MPIRSLQTIIRVEQELYAQEEAEEKNIAEWLQAQEQEIIAVYRAKRDALAGKKEEVKKLAEREAESRAAEIISKAEKKASGLAGLDDDSIRAVVRKHLHSILSGNFA